MAKNAAAAAGTGQKVEAVERALTILDAFRDGATTLSLGDIAERTTLYRSTILRLAASLERFGYLHRGEDGRFRLGPSLLALGALYQNAFNLADYVRPALARLVEETGESAAFYVREGNARICLYRQHAPRLLRHHIEEGGALPLERGAGGRVLLAFTESDDGRAGPSPPPSRSALRWTGRSPAQRARGETYEKIRRDGYCVSYGERDPEIAAIAAPVFGRERFLGAIGIAGSRTRFDAANVKKMTKVLLREAQALSRAVGAM